MKKLTFGFGRVILDHMPPAAYSADHTESEVALDVSTLFAVRVGQEVTNRMPMRYRNPFGGAPRCLLAGTHGRIIAVNAARVLVQFETVARPIEISRTPGLVELLLTPLQH